MFKVFLLLCVVFVLGQCHSLWKREDDTGVEQIIDEFLYEMADDMRQKHQEEIKIPDIEEKIQKKWKFIKLNGEFTGKGGWFKDVTTLKRRGKVEMKEEGDTMSLGLSLGLEKMEFGFEEYRAEVWHIGVHGKMTVSIGQNEVYGHITIKTDDKGCKTTLDKIEVTKLDDFHVDMTGLGKDADWIYSYVVQLIAKKYHKKITKAINEKLQPTIVAALEKKDICSKLPFI